MKTQPLYLKEEAKMAKQKCPDCRWGRPTTEDPHSHPKCRALGCEEISDSWARVGTEREPVCARHLMEATLGRLAVKP
jgi:hypothetical protein